VFIATFAGRTDAHVRWTGTGYVTVHEALTPDVVITAFAERKPVAGFFLTPASTTHVAALDLDRPDGWEIARRVGTAMWNGGCPAYVERSAAGRAHLWLTLDGEPQPGSLLRRALLAFIAEADVVGLDGDLGAAHIELRPGADRLNGPLGHSLRLPTMPHKNTGERHPLADPRTGEPLGRSLSEMLLAHRPAPISSVTAAAARYVTPISEPLPMRRPPRPMLDAPIAAFNARVLVSTVLTREFGVANAAPGRTVRCPCHDDQHASLSIGHDDRRAWCHSPTCDLHGPGGAGHDAYSLWSISQMGMVP